MSVSPVPRCVTTSGAERPDARAVPAFVVTVAVSLPSVPDTVTRSALWSPGPRFTRTLATGVPASAFSVTASAPPPVRRSIVSTDPASRTIAAAPRRSRSRGPLADRANESLAPDPSSRSVSLPGPPRIVVRSPVVKTPRDSSSRTTSFPPRPFTTMARNRVRLKRKSVSPSLSASTASCRRCPRGSRSVMREFPFRLETTSVWSRTFAETAAARASAGPVPRAAPTPAATTAATRRDPTRTARV